MQIPYIPEHVRACVLSRFSHVRLFVTPWIVACQASLPMGFSRQEYQSGLPFPSPRTCASYLIWKRVFEDVKLKTLK